MDKRVKFTGQSVKGAPVTPKQQRIRDLEKKIKRIEMENEILKKEAEFSITDYVLGYYSQTRPHSHNGGLSPVMPERAYASIS